MTKFLTVRAPWAYAMFEGPAPKSIENRTWSPSVEDLAARIRIGIHQGLRTDPAGFEFLGRPLRALEQKDLGHVIGSVQLLGAHTAGGPGCREWDCRENPWAFWPTVETPRIVHWMIGSPRRLVTPFRATGRLTLWEGSPTESHLLEIGDVIP